MVSPWHALDGQVQSAVGIIHTNYLEYARREKDGEKKEKLLRGVNATVASALPQDLKPPARFRISRDPSPSTCRGVSPHFIGVGRKIRSDAHRDEQFLEGGILHRCIWAKGHLELLERVAEYTETAASENQRLDVFGDGDDFKDVIKTAARQKLPLTFHGRADHAGRTPGYKFFINPRCLTSSPPPQRRLSRWANSWFALVIFNEFFDVRKLPRTPPGGVCRLRS